MHLGGEHVLVDELAIELEEGPALRTRHGRQRDRVGHRAVLERGDHADGVEGVTIVEGKDVALVARGMDPELLALGSVRVANGEDHAAVGFQGANEAGCHQFGWRWWRRRRWWRWEGEKWR